jgi:hypothetical protein
MGGFVVFRVDQDVSDKRKMYFPCSESNRDSSDYPSSTTVTILTELSRLTKEREEGMYWNGKQQNENTKGAPILMFIGPCIVLTVEQR